MNKALIFLASLVLAAGVNAKGGHTGGSHHRSAGHVNSHSHSVKGYTKRDGTHVAPSHATNPNGTRTDNYSHKGNVNPYTGKEGTKQ